MYKVRLCHQFVVEAHKPCLCGPTPDPRVIYAIKSEGKWSRGGSRDLVARALEGAAVFRAFDKSFYDPKII